MTITALRKTAPVRPTTTALFPVGVSGVRLASGFWGDLQALNTAVIIPHAAEWMERLDWFANLEHARDGVHFQHRGREFADSEVYKLIEAISWDAARNEKPREALLDRLLEVIAGAQDPDGYLHTLFGRAWQGPRYSDFKWGHELYCFGHLIQAAVAHHRAYGDDRFLDVARRLGDHVSVMFGKNGLENVCGHAEIEVALVELYRETNEPRYLEQARVFVERRGTGTLPLFEFGQAFWQDDVPVRAATVLRGHAVRALYLAAGAVDVAVETGDDELLAALVTQWDNTVARRTYVTGGMGSHHMDEAFGDDFVLPPDRSYCETCAGVASIMFSWRLLLATGDAKYADLIERTLYNVVAASPAPDGRSFFYANTLHQRAEHTPPPLNEDGVVIRGGAAGRQPWFEVSCCPSNVARTLASLGGYLVTGTDDAVQLHQFAAGEIAIGATRLIVRTDYPATGTISIEVAETRSSDLELSVRVPAWAASAVLSTPAGTRDVAAGYAVTSGLSSGDIVTLEIPLDVRVLYPDARIDAVRGTLAVERGPEVYALESVDLPVGLPFEDLVTTGSARYDGGTVWIRARRRPHTEKYWPFGGPLVPADDAETEIPLVRYHSWAERGPSRMRIWIPVG